MGRIRLLFVSGAIIFCAIALSSGILFLSSENEARANLGNKFIDRVGAGLIAPACGSSSINSPTCNGAVIDWTGADFSGGSYNVTLGVYTPSASSIGGTWYEFGDLNQPTSAVQSGASLLLTNFAGSVSSGFFLNANTIVAQDWGGALGTLNGNLDRIDWNNGTFWSRPAVTPVFGTLVFSQIIRTNYNPGTPDSFTWNGGNNNTPYSYILFDASSNHRIGTGGSFTTANCPPITGSIIGRIWQDSNANGAYEGGDPNYENLLQKPGTACPNPAPPVGPQPVNLNGLVVSRVSGPGNYNVEPNQCNPEPYYDTGQIPIGDYVSSLSVPAGWQRTIPPGNVNDTVDPGELQDRWFGVRPPPGVCTFAGQTGTNRIVGCLWDGIGFDPALADGNAPVTSAISAPVPDTHTVMDQNWGLSAPNIFVGEDAFSARWRGNFTFKPGSYTFYIGADDGIRLRIDGNLVIDSWVPSAYPGPGGIERSYVANFASQGQHTIELEYFERFFNARVSMRWIYTPPASPGTCNLTASANGRLFVVPAADAALGVAANDTCCTGETTLPRPGLQPYNFSLPVGSYAVTLRSGDGTHPEPAPGQTKESWFARLTGPGVTFNTSAISDLEYNLPAKNELVNSNFAVTSATNRIRLIHAAFAPPPAFDSIHPLCVLFEPLPKDYVLSANPQIYATIKSSAPAKSSETTITATSLNGFTANNRTVSVVSISPNTIPSPITHTFSPSNGPSSGRIDIPAFGIDTVTYSITVPPATPKGQYTIIFQGTGGSQPQATVLLNVDIKDDTFREVLGPVIDKLASLLNLEALGFHGK